MRELKELLLERVLDDGPGDLLLGLDRFADDALGVLEEANDAFHHAEGLVKGAVVIVIRETVLLQEVLTDDLRDLDRG